MNAEDSKRLIDDIRFALYDEIEKEVIKNLWPSISLDHNDQPFLYFYDDNGNPLGDLNLFSVVKESMSNSDDSRNQSELADALEKIVKWLRKDAARLDRKQART